MTLSRCLLIGSLLAGCATARPDAAAGRGGPAGPILTMQVDVMPRDGQMMETLPVRGTLPQGARYAIKAQVGAPAYVYAVRLMDPEGGQLISGKEAQHARPDVPVHIPDGGTWFTPDPKSGAEVLVLVAAPGPLGEAQVLSAAQRSSSPAPGRGREDAPPPVREGTRGDSVQVVQDPNGVTVARFPFTRAGDAP